MPDMRLFRISRTEMSKEMVVSARIRSRGLNPKTAVMLALKLTTFRWETTTPLGCPVDPDVYIT